MRHVLQIFLPLSGRPSAAADEEGLLDRVLLVRARLPHEELQGPAQVQEAPAAPVHSALREGGRRRGRVVPQPHEHGWRRGLPQQQYRGRRRRLNVKCNEFATAT